MAMSYSLVNKWLCQQISKGYSSMIRWQQISQDYASKSAMAMPA
jgi:hypothetical protein